MKTKTLKMVLASSVFMLSLVAILGVSKGHAFAAAKVWTGSGGNANFSTSGNWSPSGAPATGDTIALPLDVVFSSCTVDKTLNNDLVAANVTIAGLSFTGSRPANCYSSVLITGNEIKTSGNIAAPTGSYGTYINTDVTLTQSITVSGEGITFGSYTSPGTKTLALGANNFTTGNFVSIYNTITGSGSIVVTAGGLSINALSSSFTGSVTVNGNKASLNLSPCTVLPASSGITMGANTTMNLSCLLTGTVTTPITLQGKGFSDTQQGGGEYVNAAMSVGAYGNSDSDIPEITVSHVILEADSTYGSNMTADGKVTITSLTKNGHAFTRIPGSQGQLVVDGAKVPSAYLDNIIEGDYTSEYDYTVLDKSRVIVKGNQLRPFTVKKGGMLSGTGKVGNVTLQAGGIIAPGLSPGTLTTANITWVEGSNYEFEIGKDAADKIVVGGTVALGNGTLNVTLFDGAKPAAGAKYTIIENDGADAVTGTFKGLPEGATFTANGYVYQISYVGGSGNDVTLTVKSVPKAPNTGVGMLTNNPLLTLAITTASAAAIFVLAKRRTQLTK